LNVENIKKRGKGIQIEDLMIQICDKLIEIVSKTILQRQPFL